MFQYSNKFKLELLMNIMAMQMQISFLELIIEEERQVLKLGKKNQENIKKC